MSRLRGGGRTSGRPLKMLLLRGTRSIRLPFSCFKIDAALDVVTRRLPPLLVLCGERRTRFCRAPAVARVVLARTAGGRPWWCGAAPAIHVVGDRRPPHALLRCGAPIAVLVAAARRQPHVLLRDVCRPSWCSETTAARVEPDRRPPQVSFRSSLPAAAVDGTVRRPPHLLFLTGGHPSYYCGAAPRPPPLLPPCGGRHTCCCAAAVGVGRCSTTRAPYVPGATMGATAAPETWHLAKGSRLQQRDGDAGTRTTGPAAPPDPRRRGGVPDPPSGATRAPAGAGLARPRGRGRRRLTWRHAAGTERCASDGYSRSSSNDRSGGPDMHGGNYWHWLVTRVKSHVGKLGLGDSFSPFGTKGDDGGRHRCRR